MSGAARSSAVRRSLNMKRRLKLVNPLCVLTVSSFTAGPPPSSARCMPPPWMAWKFLTNFRKRCAHTLRTEAWARDRLSASVGRLAKARITPPRCVPG